MDKKNIETIVPLLPMQQGFLWQNLKTNGDAATLQLRCTLEAELDTERFKQAWNTIVQQHQALRSTVHWQDVKAPIQLVMKTISLPWTEIDLRSSPNIAKSLNEHLNNDRQTTLDLTQAPSYRLVLYQIGHTRYEMVWTLSHVLLDGWSSALVLSQVIDAYSSQTNNDDTAGIRRVSLNDHHRWLKQQDKSKLLSYWSERLAGVVADQRSPYRLEPQSMDNSDEHSEPLIEESGSSKRVTIDAPLWAELSQKIRHAGISLNTILQAAWAVQLHDPNTADHVIFGMTVSGREIDLAGAENHVGMLINLIPVVIKCDLNLSVLDWLKTIQHEFFNTIPFAHTSLQDIQTATECQGKMFDSLLVLENQPRVESSTDIAISNFQSDIVSDMDLTLVAIPGDQLTLELRYKSAHFSSDDMSLLLKRVQSVMLSLPDMFASKLAELQPYFQDKTLKADVSHASSLSARMHAPAAKPVITRLEQQLLEIWQQVLDRPYINLTDNFFDLGGSSLQAVLMFDKIHSLTGFQLPTTMLFNSPSVVSLAKVIEQQNPHSFWSTTVEIQKEGHKPPLFIPVISIDMLMYQNLSSHLGTDQPIYALRAADSALSSNELAEKLVENIRAIQPHGPYHLAGASGAGLLAWLMAQQLQEQGEKVGLLVLLDTYGPQYPTLKPPVSRMLSITAELSSRLFHASAGWIRRRLPSLPGAFGSANGNAASQREISGIQVESNMHLLAEYNQRISQEYQQALPFVLDITRNQALHERAINLLCLGMTLLRSGSFTMRIAFIVFIQGLWLEHRRNDPESPSTPRSRSIETIKQRHEHMYAALKPYAGRIAFIRVTHRPPGVVDDPYVGWSDLVSDNMSIFDIPGTHTSMLKHPNVQILADILKRELSDIPQRPVQPEVQPNRENRSLLDS